jgi:hypothetical protein
MSFWDRFESSREGIEDTVEFTIRVAVITLACVVLVVVAALVVGLFASNEVVDSDKVFEIVGPAFNMVIGAFVGLLGGLSLNANARDKKPEEPAPIEPALRRQRRRRGRRGRLPGLAQPEGVMTGNLSTVELIGQLWPIVLAFISLVIILAKMDVRVAVVEEKVKALFELWNKK